MPFCVETTSLLPFRIETSWVWAIRFASLQACCTRGDWIACSAARVANSRTPAASGGRELAGGPCGSRCLMTAARRRSRRAGRRSRWRRRPRSLVLQQLAAGVDPLVGVERLPVDPAGEDRKEGEDRGEDDEDADLDPVPRLWRFRRRHGAPKLRRGGDLSARTQPAPWRVPDRALSLGDAGAGELLVALRGLGRRCPWRAGPGSRGSLGRPRRSCAASWLQVEVLEELLEARLDQWRAAARHLERRAAAVERP